jgi:hypothetical protein
MEFGGSVLFIVLGNLRGKFTIFILLIEAFWGMPLHMGRREWVTKEGRGTKGEGAILMFRLLMSDGMGERGVKFFVY